MDTRLSTIYRAIQQQRDERLAQILHVLDQKAEDPEIAQVAQWLRLWTSEYPREHPAPHGRPPGRDAESSAVDQEEVSGVRRRQHGSP